MKIVLDAMGGDNAPQSTVEGAILASNEFKHNIILVGNEEKINAILKEKGELDNKYLTVVHSKGEDITMKDEPRSVVRAKRDSSLGKSLDMLANDEADALVSAGNSGAVLTGATLIVKRINGIRRAALAPIIPTKTGGTLVCDCGANVDCTEEYLVQFAIMGSIYFKNVMKNNNPRVGLINNGAESSKGTELYQNTYKLLEEKKDIINFIGNIEGRDIAIGGCDILVADGFTGNVLLKTYEGVGMYIASMLKGMFLENTKSKVAGLLIKDSLNELKKTMDYKEVGGAPLLGIKKPVIKAHGSCDAYAIRSAINQAIIYSTSNSIDTIEEQVKPK